METGKKNPRLNHRGPFSKMMVSDYFFAGSVLGVGADGRETGGLLRTLAALILSRDSVFPLPNPRVNEIR